MARLHSMRAVQGYHSVYLLCFYLGAGADRTDPPLDVLFGPDHGGLAAHAATADADLLLGFAAGTVTQVGRGAAEARRSFLWMYQSCTRAMDTTLAQLASWGCRRLLGRGSPRRCVYTSDLLLCN